jgi:hypothetical protein
LLRRHVERLVVTALPRERLERPVGIEVDGVVMHPLQHDQLPEVVGNAPPGSIPLIRISRYWENLPII